MYSRNTSRVPEPSSRSTHFLSCKVSIKHSLASVLSVVTTTNSSIPTIVLSMSGSLTTPSIKPTSNSPSLMSSTMLLVFPSLSPTLTSG